MTLAERIESLFEQGAPASESESAFQELQSALNEGRVRAAEPDPSSATGWRVNTWVKKGVLLGFRLGKIADMSEHGLPFFDKHTYPLKPMTTANGVRIVPGGSSIRSGAFVASGVTCMPPMYINTGAYVDEGTMVDSHALVGSCAQIGKRVHLSAAAQIGGVLEPVGAMPVIIEDEVLVGGNCGVYEGTIVKRRAILGAGTIITGSTPLYDVVHGTIHRKTADHPLIVPEGAVVVPGSRAISAVAGKDWNLSLYTPIIVKYRDDKTELGSRLEELLR